MKLSASIALLSCTKALAFTPPSFRPNLPVVPLSAHQNHIGAATTLLVGLSLSAQIAVANDLSVPPSAVSSSTILQSSSTLEQFALPSYDSAKGSTLIDLNAEVQDVNKKTLANAKAKREYVDNSAEKTAMDELRRKEKEDNSLFESMTKQSDVEKKARIEAEKAESRANRWNTF